MKNTIKKLYIVKFLVPDNDADVEWFWCDNEEQAIERFWDYIETLEYDKENVDLLDVYEVSIPNEVMDSIHEFIQLNGVDKL